MQRVTQEETNIMRETILALKAEIEQFASGDLINQTAIESIQSLIVFTQTKNTREEAQTREEAHTIEIKLPIQVLDFENVYYKKNKGYEAILSEKVERLRRISSKYYTYFVHYWNCYEQGDQEAREEFIAYGESYVLAMLETLKIEQQLFNLTTQESIVQ